MIHSPSFAGIQQAEELIQQLGSQKVWSLVHVIRAQLDEVDARSRELARTALSEV